MSEQHSSKTYLRTEAHMGTAVSVQVVGHGASQRARRTRDHAMQRAFDWFARVEAVCSRFDGTSELRRVSDTVGIAVPVSEMLFETVQFALAVADATDGAFDPTVGHRMEARGFNRHHRTGEISYPLISPSDDINFRDVELDVHARTITLHRALRLDLGAVAKGLAIDMAARELAPLSDFCINAGGDVLVSGTNANQASWTVGIRHPRDHDVMIETISLSHAAVCTSGDYERGRHILDARTDRDEHNIVSATVIAPSAMVADALATAALVLGTDAGVELLHAQDVRGLLISSTLERFATHDWQSALA